MTRARRIVLWLTLPLLLLLAAAAFALSGPTKASAAEAAYYPDLYTLRINTQIEGVMDYDNISVRLGFSETSAHPGYVTYYGMVQHFSSQLPSGKEITESFETPPLEWYVNDRLVCFYRIAYDKPLDLLTVDTWLHRDHCVLYKQQLTIEEFLSGAYYEIDCETLDEILRIQLNYRLNIGTSNIASLVTFKYKAFDDTWSEVSQLFYFGELPRLPDYYDGHWDRVFFNGWSPEIVPVTASDPVMYTAQYEYPSVLVKQKDGTVQREYLKWDYIDDELLFNNFTNEYEDVGTDVARPDELIDFTNRKDFWYCRTLSSDVVHTIDTNLTLEAISFRLRNKNTQAIYKFRNAQELHGEYSVNWNYYWYSMSQGGAQDQPMNFIEMVVNLWNKICGKDQPTEAELKQRFLERYYPAEALDDPDSYDLVYLYYYSVDLKKNVEAGKDEGYIDVKDDYKPSYLHVRNNLNDKVYDAPFGYTVENGCYFVLDMDRLWQYLGYQTKERADALGGVKAAIANAKFKIKDWTGEVVYNTADAADLSKAMLCWVYLYTGEMYPDYASSYTVTVEFYDVTVFQEDKTGNNPGSWLDKFVASEFWQTITRLFTGRQTLWDFFKGLPWWGKLIVIILLLPILLFLLRLIILVVQYVIKGCKAVWRLFSKKSKPQPPKARHKKRRAKR